jgi:membrane dipeptidase
MLVGENILRAWSEIDNIAKTIQKSGERPSEETWQGRQWEEVWDDVPRLFSKKQ